MATAGPGAGRALAQDNELGTLEVTGEREAGAETEGSGSYTTGSATLGGKGAQDLRDIPQATTVITRGRLDDQNLNTIEQAFEWDPGITVATGDTFSGSLYARGHEIFQYSVDGMIRPLLSIYGTAPDLYFFDRVEVLSGPGGLFGGSGEPGATVNLARKRAQRDFGVSGSVYAGSFNAYRGEADITGAVDDAGAIRVRAAGYYDTQDSFVDVVESDRGGAYGTVEFDVTDQTKVAFGAIHEQHEVNRFAGLPTFADGTLLDVSRNTYIGADYDQFELDATELFAELEHGFDFGGTFRFGTRLYDRKAEIVSVLPITSVDPATGNFTLFTFARDYDETSFSADGSLVVPFTAWGLSSEVTAGADFRRSEQLTKQQFVFGAGTQNIFFPDPNIPAPEITFPGVGPGFNLNSEVTINEFGLYTQGRVEVIEGLSLLAGARGAFFETQTEDLGRDITSHNSEQGVLTPYGGLTFDVTEDVTLFASYTEIFQPQTELSFGGEVLDPREGYQVEIGAKGAFFDGALTAQVAAYRLEDENRAVDDPVNVGFSLESGEALTQGVEVSLGGSPYPGLQIWAGYVFTDTDFDGGSGDDFGEITPEHSYSLWARYTFLEGAVEGLSFGAGLRGVSDVFSISGDTRIKAEDYVVVDAQVGYQITESIGASLTVSNLLDEKYYQRVNQTTRGNFYGAPRSFTLKLSAQF